MLLSKESKMSEVDMALVRHFTEISLDANSFVKQVSEFKTKEIEFVDVPDEGSALLNNDIKDRIRGRQSLNGFKDVTADTIAYYYNKSYLELTINDIYNFLIDVFHLSKQEARLVIEDTIDKLTTCKAVDILPLYASTTTFHKVILKSLRRDPILKKRYMEIEGALREGFINQKARVADLPKPARCLRMIAFMTNDFNSFYLIVDGKTLALNILNSKSITITDGEGKSTDINKIEGVKISNASLDNFPKIVRDINKADMCLIPAANSYITCDIFSAYKYELVEDAYKKLRKSINNISGNLNLVGYIGKLDINNPVLLAQKVREIAGTAMSGILPQDDTISRKASTANAALKSLNVLFTNGFDASTVKELFNKYVNATTSESTSAGARIQGSQVSKTHSYSNSQHFLMLVEGLASLRKLIDYCDAKGIDILSIPSDIFIRPLVGVRFKTLEDYMYSYKYYKELDNECIKELGTKFDDLNFSMFDYIRSSDELIAKEDGVNFRDKDIPLKVDYLELSEISKLRFSMAEKALVDSPDLYNDKACLTLGISLQRYFNKQYARENKNARDFLNMVYGDEKGLKKLYIKYKNLYSALYSFLNIINNLMNSGKIDKIYECKFIVNGSATYIFKDKTYTGRSLNNVIYNDLNTYEELINEERKKLAEGLTRKLNLGHNKEVEVKDISVKYADVHLSILNVENLENKCQDPKYSKFTKGNLMSKFLYSGGIIKKLQETLPNLDINSLGNDNVLFFNVIRLITLGYTVMKNLMNLCDLLSEYDKSGLESLKNYEVNCIDYFYTYRYLFKLPKKGKTAKYSNSNINMISSCINRLPENYYLECLNVDTLSTLKDSLSNVYDIVMEPLWGVIDYIDKNKKIIDNWIYNLGRVDNLRNLRENFIKASAIIRYNNYGSSEHSPVIDEIIRNRDTHISEHMFVVTKEGDYVATNEGGFTYYLHANNLWYCPEKSIDEFMEVKKDKVYSIIYQHSEL